MIEAFRFSIGWVVRSVRYSEERATKYARRWHRLVPQNATGSNMRRPQPCVARCPVRDRFRSGRQGDMLGRRPPFAWGGELSQLSIACRCVHAMRSGRGVTPWPVHRSRRARRHGHRAGKFQVFITTREKSCSSCMYCSCPDGRRGTAPSRSMSADPGPNSSGRLLGYRSRSSTSAPT